MRLLKPLSKPLKLISHIAKQLGLVDSMLTNYHLGHIGKVK